MSIEFKNGDKVRIWGCSEETNGLVGTVKGYAEIGANNITLGVYCVELPPFKDPLRKWFWPVRVIEKKYLELIM